VGLAGLGTPRLIFLEREKPRKEPEPQEG